MHSTVEVEKRERTLIVDGIVSGNAVAGLNIKPQREIEAQFRIDPLAFERGDKIEKVVQLAWIDAIGIAGGKHGAVVPDHVYAQFCEAARKVIERETAEPRDLAGRIHGPKPNRRTVAEREAVAVTLHKTVVPGGLLIEVAQIEQGILRKGIQRRLPGEETVVRFTGLFVGFQFAAWHKRHRGQQEAIEAGG